MAEKDFVVKNGLQINGTSGLVVNGAFTVNATGIHNSSGTRLANTTHFFNANVALTANNANNLGGVAAASYVNTSGSYTLSGNLNFTAANNYFASGWKVGANVTATTDSITFGNTSVNAVINSTGVYVNGSALATGGGYYKGNGGAVGDSTNKANLYRVNSNTQSNNVTISAGENALTVGPMVISNGYNLTIEEGGRAVII
jgi:hypothetical protein